LLQWASNILQAEGGRIRELGLIEDGSARITPAPTISSSATPRPAARSTL